MGNARIPDLNAVTLAGRLTRDPDLQYTAQGKPYCKCGMASTRYYRDGNNDRKEETTFVDFVIFGDGAERMAEHLAKGNPVILEGRLKTEEWEDRNSGQKRSRISIIASRVQPLEWAGTTEDRRPAPPAATPDNNPVPEDDLPF